MMQRWGLFFSHAHAREHFIAPGHSVYHSVSAMPGDGTPSRTGIRLLLRFSRFFLELCLQICVPQENIVVF